MKISTIVASAALALTAATSQAATIDFESDAIGVQSNGFQSVDSNLVSFSDSLGANLNLFNYGTQGDGISLAVKGDDASKLLMSFTTAVTNLSLDFGNDDPSYSNAGDTAFLDGFLGGSFIGRVMVEMNRNDLMDQSILFGLGQIDSASFFYGDDQGNAINLIEIVDNINFEVSAVPLPGGALLLLSGIGGLAFSRRRKTA